jgi:hypothetical protein
MMNEIDSIDCRNLSFSVDLSESRLTKAQLVFGEKVLKRIIVFSLYMLGVRRIEIAQAVKLPENTVRTMLETISRNGVASLLNRRKKRFEVMEDTVSKLSKKENIEITERNDRYQISINGTDIFILKSNRDQLKAMVLTFAENGLITKIYAGKILNISSSHVGYLINNVTENDLSCLIDQRKGQQKNFVFTPEIKSELIVQFAVNATTGRSTSSPVLAKDIEQRTSHELSPRSIRFHINSLGLKGKAAQLWELVGLKKTL